MTAARISRTERQWLLSLLLTLGLVALFAGIGRLERAGAPADDDARFVRSPSETVTRFLAIGHTVVATSFLLTSKKVRRRRTALGLVGVAALGVGVCVGFAALGGMRATIAGFLFYAYFLAHELRDEGWLTSRNGDAGPPPASVEPAAAGFIAWTPTVVALLVLLAVGAAGIAFGGASRRLEAVVGGLDPTLRAVGAAAVLALALAGILVVLRRAARFEGTTIRGHLARRRPHAFVTAGLLVVLLGGAALTGRLYLIVALHVVWWAVFAYDGLRRAPPPAVRPAPLTWAWVRTTPAGFAAYHVAVLVAVAAIAAIHAYAGRNDPSWTPAVLLASREAFPYWTLMHVSLSWLPR